MSVSDSGFSETELRKFSEAGRVIASAVGTSVELWARAEAGVILKTWAGKTKVAKPRALEISALLREYRQVRRVVYGSDIRKGSIAHGESGINLGIRGPFGRVWYRSRTKGRKFQMAHDADFSPPPRPYHLHGSDWSLASRMIQIFRQQYRLAVEAAHGAGGLARQSIVQIADDLGIRLEDVKGGGTLSAAGINKARNALASNKNPYKNGLGIIGSAAQEFYVTLVNRYPRMGPLFMDQTLRIILAGRLKYFRRNLEEGTFLAAHSAAKAYPYLEVLRTAA